MKLLTEEQCRAVVERYGNDAQLARWFYEDAPTVPERPHPAFVRVLSVSPMTERTRLRISNLVLRYFQPFAEAYGIVGEEEDCII